jgi:hypothetical protein
MKVLAKRTAVVTLLVAMVLVHGLTGMVVCANYVSSGARNRPITGWLVGERTYTQTSTRSASASWGFRAFRGMFSRAGTKSSSYGIGTYEMSDGTRRDIRCDRYRYI